MSDPHHILAIINEYQHQGLHIALDDFGAGFCGLNRLADQPVDIIKLDMASTRRIEQRPVARTIVDQMMQLAKKLNKTVIRRCRDRCTVRIAP